MYKEVWIADGEMVSRWHHDNSVCLGLCRSEIFCHAWYSFVLATYEALARKETQA